MNTVTKKLCDFMLQVLNAMHVRTFTKSAHQHHVRGYILPSVLHKWRLHQTDLLAELKERESVCLGGDMRADSPGHCAKYGSYSMMDLTTSKIVDIQLVQVSRLLKVFKNLPSIFFSFILLTDTVTDTYY